MKTLSRLGTIAALVGVLAGCRGMSQEEWNRQVGKGPFFPYQEATETADRDTTDSLNAEFLNRDQNCRHTADRYQRITICQLADRERWITTPHQRFGRLEETTTDYFPDGRAVVYKRDGEVWEYSQEGVTMTDGLGNRYKMELGR